MAVNGQQFSPPRQGSESPLTNFLLRYAMTTMQSHPDAPAKLAPALRREPHEWGNYKIQSPPYAKLSLRTDKPHGPGEHLPNPGHGQLFIPRFTRFPISRPGTTASMVEVTEPGGDEHPPGNQIERGHPVIS